MKTATQIAKEAFSKIENSTVQAVFQVSYHPVKGYKIGRYDTAIAEETRRKAPETVAGCYDWTATVKQIADDLVAVGCPR